MLVQDLSDRPRTSGDDVDPRSGKDLISIRAALTGHDLSHPALYEHLGGLDPGSAIEISVRIGDRLDGLAFSIEEQIVRTAP
jgi:hypothetical protein